MSILKGFEWEGDLNQMLSLVLSLTRGVCYIYTTRAGEIDFKTLIVILELDMFNLQIPPHDSGINVFSKKVLEWSTSETPFLFWKSSR